MTKDIIDEIMSLRTQLNGLTIGKVGDITKIVELKRQLQGLYVASRREKRKLELTYSDYPKYVIMGKTNLPLVLETRGLQHVYSRLNGVWNTSFKVVDQLIYSVNKDYPHLDGVLLAPVSKTEFIQNTTRDKKFRNSM